MNIIVSNKQKDIIDNANIDAIKDLNGLFNVDDLLGKLKNYFFSRVILDATSLINFTSDEVLQKLVDDIGGERLFILLPAVPEPPKEFVEKLINLKIYNFSNKISELINFINNPQNQNNLASSIENSPNNFYVDSSVKEDDEDSNNMTISSAINSVDANDVQNDFSLENVLDSMNISSNKEEDSSLDNGDIVLNNPVSDMFSSINVDNPFPVLDNPNNSQGNNFGDGNIFLHHNLGIGTSEEERNNRIIIGFKNVTDHAGSTSLIYMLLKTIESVYHKKVIAIEIDSDNFKYYQMPNMFSVNSSNINNVLNAWDAEVILVDLNGYDNLSICSDVLYLVEPSIIRLNKLMMEDSEIFIKLNGKRVILNMSLLNDNEVMAFSKEAGMPMFYNIPPLNDRIQNNVLSELWDKLAIK